jgi:hypothetical protein
LLPIALPSASILQNCCYVPVLLVGVLLLN